ncbi:LexA family transcriptional regulator [Sphingosinicella rhizophila]|uniref:S24 family peptidase n=1 Tax=Sphingosinicella rhizophila TaxID=3050082 RepID=A0ABU3Q6Q5_9SPHN|nr:S24 family peptidase [Sphingosinicella sp. GR2756]MDT9598648.1 S24 family peptidase [Sphingosinicella sp. GR2756]
MTDLLFDLDLVRTAMDGPPRVTQAALAQVTGLNQSAISNILKGSRRVKVEEADLIYSFLGISRTPSVQMVPVIGLASAGNWKEAIIAPPGGMMPVPSKAAGRKAFAVEVKGDSMDRIIPDGGFAIVDPEQTQLFNDKVYLIQNEEHDAQVKLYRSNPARFEPVSSNELHKTIYLGEQVVRVIGRVVWQGAPL